MNSIYKTVWSVSSQTMVAVSELAKSAGKSSSKVSGQIINPKSSLSKLAVAFLVAFGANSAYGASITIGVNPAGINNGQSSPDVNLVGPGVGVGPKSINAVAVGQNSSIGNNATAVGHNAGASGNMSVALGNNARAGIKRIIRPVQQPDGRFLPTIIPVEIEGKPYTTAIGANSEAIKLGNTAVGAYSKAEGTQSTAVGGGSGNEGGAYAKGAQSVAIGGDSVAKGNSTIAIGNDDIDAVVNDSSTGSNDTAEGFNDTVIAKEYKQVTGEYLIQHVDAQGEAQLNVPLTKDDKYRKTIAGGEGSIAVGVQTTSKGDLSTAVGTRASSNGMFASAYGVNANAEGEGSVAVGLNTKARGVHSIAIGNSARADGLSTTYEETADATPDDEGSVKMVTSIGEAIAMGRHATASAAKAIAIGSGAVTGSENHIDANGVEAISIGSKSGATQNWAVAIGTRAKATEQRAVAIGKDARASGMNSIAQGNLTQAQGKNSVAFGYNTVASAERAYAIGYNSKASAESAIAFGSGSVASADSALALGRANTASGVGSIAIGSGYDANDANYSKTDNLTTATGDHAIALGHKAKATANNAIALGDSAKASNVNSVALGSGSVDQAPNAVSDAVLTLGNNKQVTYSATNFAGNTGISSVVSIGTAGSERQLVNVAAGRIQSDSTDAINGSQLYEVADKLGKEIKNVAATASTDTNSVEKVIAKPNSSVEVTEKARTGVKGQEFTVGLTQTAEDAIAAVPNKASKNLGDINTDGENVIKGLIKVDGTAPIEVAKTQDGKADKYTVSLKDQGVEKGKLSQAVQDQLDKVETVEGDTNINVNNTGENSSHGKNFVLSLAKNLNLDKNPQTANQPAGSIDGLANHLPNPTATATSHTPKPEDEHKAATVGDVLHSGWNLQENATAKSFVKAYDTVNFVNGEGTTAKVTTAGNTSNVTFDVNVDNATVELAQQPDGSKKIAAKTTTLSPSTTGTINAGDQNSLVKAGDVATAINDAFHKVANTNSDTLATVNTGETEVKAGSKLTFDAGKNLISSLSNNTLKVSTKDDVKFKTIEVKDGAGKPTVAINSNGVTVTPDQAGKNPVTLTKDGLDNGGNTITNVAKGVNPTDAVNVDQLKTVTENVVQGDGITVSSTPATADKGKTFTVSARTDGTTITTDGSGNLKANTTALNPATAGNIAVPTNGDQNKLMNAGDIAKAINNSYHKVTNENTDTAVSATAQNNIATANIKAGDTLTFEAGKNLLSKMTTAGKLTASLKDDLTGLNSVVLGNDANNADTVALTTGGIKAGNKKITNVGAGTNPTDAVNFGQLGSVTENVTEGKGISVTKTNANGNTGASFNVAVKTDGTTIIADPQTGNLKANTTALTPATAGNIAVPTNGDENKLVNAGEIANAINNSFHSVTNKNTDDAVTAGQATAQIKAGSTLTFEAGKNLNSSLTAGGLLKVSTKDDLTGLNSVVLGNDANDPKTVALTTGGVNAGGKKITNVDAGTAPNDAVNFSQLDKLAKSLKKTGAASKENVTSQDKSVTINKTVATDGSTTFDLAVKVDSDTLEFVADPAQPNGAKKLTPKTTTLAAEPETTAGQANPNAGKVATPSVDDAKKLVKAGDIATAINGAGFKVTTTNGKNGTKELIKMGETVEFDQGKNIEIEQAGNKFIVKTADDLKDLNSVVLGNDKTDPNTVALTKDGINAGSQKIANVKSALPHNPNQKYDDTTNGTNNATVAPAQNVVKAVLAEPKDEVLNSAATVRDIQAVSRAGLDFVGDNNATVVHKNLGEKLEIIGGADKNKLSDNNIGVNAEAGKLEVKLAKKLTGLTDVILGDQAGDDVVSLSKDNGINAGDKKITNVAKGNIADDSEDAINGSQLNDLAKKLGVAPKANKTGFEDPAFTALKNVDGNNATAPTNVVNAVNDLAGKVNDGLIFAGNTGEETQQLGSKLEVKGEDKVTGVDYSSANITTEYTNAGGNGVIKISMKEKPEFKGVEIKDGTTNPSVSIAPEGVTITPNATDTQAGKKPVKLTKDGLNNGGNKIVNVAEGVDETDAVNVKQLKDTLGKSADNSPFEYADADGNSVIKKGNKFVDAKTGADVPKENVVIKPKGTEPKALTKIQSTLPNSVDHEIKDPTQLAAAKKAQTAPVFTGDEAHNAATISDVLSAGWNLQGNGTGVDFVKAYDTVNFVNGEGTTARVTTDTENKVNQVTFDVAVDNKTTELTATKDGKKVVKNAAGKWVTTDAEGNPTATELTEDEVKVLRPVVSAKTAKLPIEPELTAGTQAPNPNAGKVATPAQPDALATAGDIAEAVNGAYHTVKNTNTDATVTEADGSSKVKAGSTLTFEAGKNLSSVLDANGLLKVSTKDEVEFKSVNLKDGANETKLTTTANGLDVGGDKITNMAKGDISDTSKDAINGSQLNDLAKKLGVAPTANKTGFEDPTFTALKNVDGNNATAPTTVVNAVNDLADKVNAGLTFGGNTGKKAQQLGSTLEVKGEDKTAGATYTSSNITTDYTNTDGNGVIKISMKEKPEFKGVEIKDGTATPTVAITKDGMTITPVAGTQNPDGTAKAPVSVTKDGLDNGGNQIKNVKAGVADTDGVNVKQLKDLAGNSPFEYANANGDSLTKVGNKFYTDNELENGKPKANATGLDIADVVIKPKGTPKSLTKIKSTLPNSVDHEIKDPTQLAAANKAQTAPTFTSDEAHNAATISDVLSAGWNVQNNGTAKDFVKAYDTVNFVNGNGTTAKVTVDDKGEKSDVSFSVNVDDKTTEIKYKQADGSILVKDGNVYKDKDGNAVAVADPTTLKEVVTAKTTKLIADEKVDPKDATKKVPTGTVSVPDANKDSLATAGDIADAINNAGFVVTASANGGNVKGASDELINAGDKLELVAGEHLTIKQEAGKFTFSTNNQAIANDAQLPVAYTDKAGNKVYKITKADGSTEFNTAKDGKGTKVEPANIIASMNGADGSTTNPTTLANVKSNLPATVNNIDGNTTATTAQVAPTPADADKIKHNAATVEDILNAGWNIENNGVAKDFVKAYDKVNFVNGKGTTATVAVDGKGEKSNVSFSVNVDDKTTEIAKFVGGKKVVEVAGKKYTEDQLDKDGKVKVNQTALTNEQLAKATDAVVAKTTKLIADEKVDPKDASKKVPTGTVSVPDANKDSLATAGDIADAINNAGFVVTASANGGNVKGASEELINAGDKLELVAGEHLTIKQEAGKFTFSTNNQAIANDAQLPVAYTDKAGNKVYKLADGTFNTAKDGKGTAVDKGDIIASMNGADGSTTNPTTLANVKSTLAGSVDQAPLTAEQSKGMALPTLTKAQKHNAATVSDVMSAGWNLQNNGTAKDFVKAYDKVNFVNGTGTTAKVTVDDKGEKSDVSFSVNVDDKTTEIKYKQADGSILVKDGNVYKDKDGNAVAVADPTTLKEVVAAKTTDLTVNDGSDAAKPAGTVSTAQPDSLATAGDITNAINGAFHKVANTNTDTTVTASAGTSNIKAGDTLTIEAGKNLVSSLDSQGHLAISTKTEVEFNKTTIGGGNNAVVIDAKGIHAGNKKITDVGSGLDGRQIDQIKADGEKNAPEWNNAVSVGDLVTVRGNVNTILGGTIGKPVEETVTTSDGREIKTTKDQVALITYDVKGQTEVLNNNVLSAVNNMNKQGIKFFHTNDGTNYKEGKGKNDQDSTASGKFATGIGFLAKASGKNALAIGKGSQAAAEDSIAIGTGNIVHASHSGAFGDPSYLGAKGGNTDGSYIIGNNNGTKAKPITASNAFIIGNNVNEVTENSVVLGNRSAATAGEKVGTVNKTSTGAKGKTTTAGDKGTVKTATVGGITYGGFAGATAHGVVSVGASGSERRIQNVAAGEISATSTDAINGSQLHATNVKLANVSKQLGDLDKDMRAGVAGAFAAANLGQPHDPGASTVGVAVGTYRGESALSLGLSTISDNGKWILKGSISHDTSNYTGAGASINYQW